MPQPVAGSFAWREPVGALLGSGGFASVWALTDRVIKIAHASHELARARIAREAEALRSIDVPAVPHLHESGVLADGRAWLVMDRVVGTTLASLTAEGPLRTSDAVAVGLAILDALERVHAMRFVHRDLKPDNLVRTTDGRVVILDLGLAFWRDAPPRDGTFRGTIAYAAPEVARGEPPTAKSDLFSLAAVFLHAATGEVPHAERSFAAALASVAETPLLEAHHRALASRGPAHAAMIRCLAHDPAERPESAREAC